MKLSSGCSYLPCGSLVCEADPKHQIKRIAVPASVASQSATRIAGSPWTAVRVFAGRRGPSIARRGSRLSGALQGQPAVARAFHTRNLRRETFLFETFFFVPFPTDASLNEMYCSVTAGGSCSFPSSGRSDAILLCKAM